MRTSLIASISAVTLVLASCGGGGASGDQGKVADLLMEQAENDDLALDKDCINDLASELSDEDAKAIADAGVDGDPDVSDEADVIGDKIIDCIDVDGFLDSMVEVATETDDTLDADCLKNELKDAETAEEVSDMFTDAMAACAEG